MIVEDLERRIGCVLAQAVEHVRVEPPLFQAPTRPAGGPEARRGERSGQRGHLPRLPEMGPAHPVRRRTGWTLAASTATAVALAGTLTLVHGDHQSASADPTLPAPLIAHQGSHDDGVALLTKMAALQASRPTPSSVMFAKTRNYALSTTAAGSRSTTDVMTVVREAWVSASGPARIRESEQATTPAGGDVGGPIDHGWESQSGDYRGHSWGDPNLPRQSTVESAYSYITASMGGEVDDSGDAVTMDFTIGDVVVGRLSSGTATPVQLAANYHLLATAPGVFDAGQVIDSAGRQGVAVGVETSDPRWGATSTRIQYFVMDASTGALLETESVDSSPPLALKLPDKPTIEEYSLILTTGSTDELGQALSKRLRG